MISWKTKPNSTKQMVINCKELFPVPTTYPRLSLET